MVLRLCWRNLVYQCPSFMMRYIRLGMYVIAFLLLPFPPTSLLTRHLVLENPMFLIFASGALNAGLPFLQSCVVKVDRDASRVFSWVTMITALDGECAT